LGNCKVQQRNNKTNTKERVKKQKHHVCNQLRRDTGILRGSINSWWRRITVEGLEAMICAKNKNVDTEFSAHDTFQFSAHDTFLDWKDN
jgi:hypothetical protein